MNKEYHRWWSPYLGHDMEVKVYGHEGKAVLVFPSTSGEFYEYEDQQMVDVCRPFIDTGKIKLFTVDSIDDQTWLNHEVSPSDRARRYDDYDRYILHEILPFIRAHGTSYKQIIATGCGMGATHAAIFFFRHPDVCDTLIALSGMYSAEHVSGDLADEGIARYFPLAYLSGLDDPWFLERYRQSQIIFCVGQGEDEEMPLADTRAMQAALEQNEIPAWIDFWGYDVTHDWEWWRKQIVYFLGHLSCIR